MKAQVCGACHATPWAYTKAAAMTTDERIDAIAKRLDELTRIHIDASREYRERLEANEERLEANEERAARAEERAAAAEERHDREMAAIRGELRRAVLLSIREARAERCKRRELDEKITQLAAAQLVTEEKLQRLIDTRSGKGKP